MKHVGDAIAEYQIRAARLLRDPVRLHALVSMCLRQKADEYVDDTLALVAHLLDPSAPLGVRANFTFTRGKPVDRRRWFRAVEAHHQIIINGHAPKVAFAEAQKVRAEKNDNVSTKTIETDYYDNKDEIAHLDQLQLLRDAIDEAEGRPVRTEYSTDHLRAGDVWLTLDRLRNPAELSGEDD